MARRLKVYGMNTSIGRHSYRVIVAAPNMKEAAGALGVTPYHLRTYGCATGNDDEIAQATSRPGVALKRPEHFMWRGRAWTELDAPDGLGVPCLTG